MLGLPDVSPDLSSGYASLARTLHGWCVSFQGLHPKQACLDPSPGMLFILMTQTFVQFLRCVDIIFYFVTDIQSVGRPWGCPFLIKCSPKRSLHHWILRLEPPFSPIYSFTCRGLVIGMGMCDAFIFQWCRFNYHTKISWRSHHPRIGQIRAPLGWLLLCSVTGPQHSFSTYLLSGRTAFQVDLGAALSPPWNRPFLWGVLVAFDGE